MEGGLTAVITAAGVQLLAAVDGKVEGAIRARMAGIHAGKLRTVVEVLDALRAQPARSTR